MKLHLNRPAFWIWLLSTLIGISTIVWAVNTYHVPMWVFCVAVLSVSVANEAGVKWRAA